MNTKPDTSDYRILADLAERKLPSKRDLVYIQTPVVLDEISLDLKSEIEYRRKQAYSLKFRAPKWEKGLKVTESGPEIPRGEEELRTGSRIFDLTREDLASALENIAEPATALNRFKVAFGRMIFSKMHKVKGYTIGPNSKDYTEINDKLVPSFIGVYDMSKEALEAYRQKRCEEWATPVIDFEEHCEKISHDRIFVNDQHLCEVVSMEHRIKLKEGRWLTGFTKAYSDKRSVDTKNRIITPISHYILDLEGFFNLTECRTIGYLAYRPVLSTGEVATPEVIGKYLGGRQ